MIINTYHLANMIIWKTGSIFDSNCKTLVNTVNCEGVMGKGLALQFKEKYKCTPMFKCYQHYCKYGKNGHNSDMLLYKGGSIVFWYFSKADDNEQWLTLMQPLNQIVDNNAPRHHVLHFATKEFWRNPSKIEWIEEGLYRFAEKDYNGKKFWQLGTKSYIEGMKTIAWPKLGCTNGGLDWESQVKPLMIRYLDPLPIECEIYE